MAVYSSTYSPAFGSNNYLFGGIFSTAVGGSGSVQSCFSPAFGHAVADLANTGVTGMAGHTQLPADWAAVSGITQILNKPTLAVVGAA